MEKRQHSQSAKKKVSCLKVIDKIEKKKNRRLKYDPSDVENALKAIKDTGLSLRKAAVAFGVPLATLGRKKSIGPDKIKKKSGPETVLSSQEEDDIVKWVLDRAAMGAPVAKTELLDCVQKYVQKLALKNPFTDNRPSRHWYEGFRKRHPELSIRKPQHLSVTRAAVSCEELQEWFKKSGAYLESKNLSNIPPTRIFNCDESSLQLCPDAESVLAGRGSRAVYKIVDGGKEALTVLFMYRADGVRGPPMLMYSYKRTVPKKIVDNTPTGWGIGLSDNGWMTTETFYEYITNVFYSWLVEQQTEFPVLLYMDNHSSHLNLPLVSFCREKQIELVMLPPNSTHIMQPLDISFFRPFKDSWKKCVPKWKNQEGVAQIKKENFPLVLKFTLDNMKNEKNVVVSGFKGSGLYPFDYQAVDYDVLQKGKKSKQTINQKENNWDSDNIEDKEFLLKFEKNLPADTLSEFQNAATSGSWIGDIEKKGLFEYWLTISKNTTNISSNNFKQTPILEKSENADHNSESDAEKTTIIYQPYSPIDLNVDDQLSTNVNTQVLQPVIINLQDNDFNALYCEENTSLDYDRQILDLTCEVDTLNNQKLLIDCANHQTELSEPNNNRLQPTINTSETLTTRPLKEIFTLPIEYLPPKKRVKIEKSKKLKLPSVGTSDEWYKQLLEKENIKIIKEEKIKKKKKLQEEKKKLMDKVKELQKKIKEDN